MKQNVTPDEIIIVNNNSTDNTVMIALKYPVKIINEAQQGMTYARNRGFNEAKYEILARTDADTKLPKNWVKRIKKQFEDEKLIGISGPSFFYDLPPIVQKSRIQTKNASLNIMKTYNKIVKQLVKHDCLIGNNMVIRKSAWKKVKKSICLDDKQVHEDIDLAIHMAPIGKIKFINNFVVSTSVRRWKHPSAYPEYLYRGLKSIQRHEQFTMKYKSKQLIKKLANKAFFFDQIPTDFK
jgi:glycosyltransferase involved in cell wall biosynthesis